MEKLPFGSVDNFTLIFPHLSVNETDRVCNKVGMLLLPWCCSCRVQLLLQLLQLSRSMYSERLTQSSPGHGESSELLNVTIKERKSSCIWHSFSSLVHRSYFIWWSAYEVCSCGVLRILLLLLSHKQVISALKIMHNIALCIC